MNAQDVVNYLEQHPEFFQDQGDLLASVQIPHPHGGRAISLTERQMMTLRERHKALELKLAELIRYGQENDAIAEKLNRWTLTLLMQRNLRTLPDHLGATLSEIFDIPHTALAIWEASEDHADLPCAQPVPVGLINYSNQLAEPYCGMPLEANSGAVALIGEQVKSIAIIALRREPGQASFGLLVLASNDAQRFTADMGTAFLTRIGTLASAALSRLVA